MVAQNTLRTCEGNTDQVENNFKFATASDLNKCLDQVKLPISLNTCTPMTELPTSISTVIAVGL